MRVFSKREAVVWVVGFLAALILTADSDDLARVYRFDLAQDSEMISPTIPI